MIHWPAILHHTGQDDLSYFENQADWDAQPRQNHLRPADRLIDADGRVWMPDTTHNQETNGQRMPLKQTGEILPLAHVLYLVRAHAALNGSCCTAKLAASSIFEAIQLVPTLDD